MKKSAILLALLLVMPFQMWAAGKNFSFECRTKIIRGGEVIYEYRQHTFYFKMEVISDYQGRKPEKLISNRYPYIMANPGERYAVRLYNPLPVKVAVNLSIDGLNSITGEPCTPSSGNKWIINPRGYVTIRGWQVSDEAMRRFYFTSRERSYAAWQSNQWGYDLTVHCGMIAAAYFWNRRDMERHFERHPIIEGPIDDEEVGIMQSPKAQEKSMRSHDAGTGMGEKEHHPVHEVDFKYNMGMYEDRKAVKIYYDFYSYPYGYGHKKYIPRQPHYAPEPDDEYNDDDDHDDDE